MAVPNREIETDVLVVGGGTAGFAAALAAACAGLRVRLIEAGPKIGGVMASCPGMPWGGGYPLAHIIGGIFGEQTDRLTAMAPPCAEARPCTLENFGPDVRYARRSGCDPASQHHRRRTREGRQPDQRGFGS
jgi:choline dehydrogenase-like flavoprotein